MNAEQLASLLATHNELRNVNITQADNGFTIVGQRRFADKDTGVVTAQLERQAVAATHDAALVSAQCFFNTGSFLPAVAAPQQVI